MINLLFHSSEQVARKKSKRQKRAAKKAEEDFLYKVRPTGTKRSRVRKFIKAQAVGTVTRATK